MQVKTIFYIISFTIVLIFNQVFAEEGKYHQFILNNQMQVLVVPNHKLPIVNHLLLYNVGSVDDPVTKSGLAHFLEHMLFKSTNKFKEGEFASAVNSLGGYLNAFTGYDYTGYFEVIPKDALPLIMEMEAERMVGLRLKEDEVAREREVILEERRLRTENNPNALLNEQMRAALYLNHLYGRPNIGWMHEIKTLSQDDIVDFYKKYYTPNNALLVISGDITLDDAKSLAQKYYGNITISHSQNERFIPSEPNHIAERKVIIKNNLINSNSLSRVYLSFNNQHDNNLYHEIKLEILSVILGGNNISRLYKSLVKHKKYATEVASVVHKMHHDAGIFYIFIKNNHLIKNEKIERQLDEEINILTTKGVTQEELDLAKDILKKEIFFEQENINNTALIYALTYLKSYPLDSITNLQKYLDKIKLEDINNLAKELFVKEHSVTGYLLADKQVTN